MGAAVQVTDRSLQSSPGCMWGAPGSRPFPTPRCSSALPGAAGPHFRLSRVLVAPRSKRIVCDCEILGNSRQPTHLPPTVKFTLPSPSQALLPALGSIRSLGLSELGKSVPEVCASWLRVLHTCCVRAAGSAWCTASEPFQLWLPGSTGQV